MKKAILKEKRSPLHYIFKFSVLILLLVGFASYGFVSKTAISQHDTFLNNTDSFDFMRNTFNDDHDDDECIPHDKEDPCSYIKLNENCDPDGYFDYLDLYYCKLKDKKWASYIIMILWLIVLFYALGSTADKFFCPTLEVLGDLLKMSPEVAGLTLLALGNGAPDVSSVVAGVVGSNSFPIAIGELFGSGLFIITVIVAFVAFIAKHVQMDSHSFLRDTFFYLIAMLSVFFITWDCKITLVESILFLVYYFGYVSFALIVHYCGCLKSGNEPENEDTRTNDSETAPLIPEESHINQVDETDETEGYFTLASWWQELKEKSILMKIYTIISTILIFPIYISIPGVKWNRYQAVLTPITAVPIIFIISDQIGKTVNGFPIVVIVMLCMIIPSAIIFFTTKWEEPPAYKHLFLALGFILSVMWIYMVAEELVALLQAMGIILNVSSAIMGATVLAWGNSVGDLISDIVVTRKGNPRMALGATYGGPLFNLLVGLGLALTIKNIKTFPEPFAVAPNHLIYATAAFLFFALYVSMVLGFVRKYRLSWWYGIFLMVVYVVFTVVILLIELQIFWPDNPNEVCIPW